METRDLKSLLDLMKNYGLVELEIEDKKGKVRLVRGAAADAVANPAANSIARATALARAAKVDEVDKVDASDGEIALAPNQKLIESPMVGTFYRAASPDAAPFVEEGGSVRKGQPLCIIEAMKMMNEIEAPAAGRVVKILCENGQPIQYGQPLLILEVG